MRGDDLIDLLFGKKREGNAMLLGKRQEPRFVLLDLNRGQGLDTQGRESLLLENLKDPFKLLGGSPAVTADSHRERLRTQEEDLRDPYRSLGIKSMVDDDRPVASRGIELRECLEENNVFFQLPARDLAAIPERLRTPTFW